MDRATFESQKAMEKEQRRAIIMGATSGIGLEVAKVLAGEGWLVGIAGRRQELLQQIQRKHRLSRTLQARPQPPLRHQTQRRRLPQSLGLQGIFSS